MAMSMQSGENSRFTDLCDEPIDHLLSPIKGFQDKPLVSLTKAIEPVSGFFNEIKGNVIVALHNCQNPADGLTQEESASIHLYTMEFHGGPSLYLLLNQSLRAENREQLKPWFSFLKLFLTALHKLPSQSDTVWRGVRDVDLSSKYKTGTKFAWWGVSSCTINIDALASDRFLGEDGERTLFSIQCINGKSVVNHSYYKTTEKEVILMPGSYFEVIGQLNSGHQLHIIQLREIPPPTTLVQAPFSKSTDSSLPSILKKSNTSSQATPKTNTQNMSSKTISKGILIKPNSKWKQHGITVAGGNGKGDKLNQLSHPFGIFIDDNQSTYVADWYNHRIVEWRSNANIGRLVAGGNGKGNKTNQLNRPRDVIIDKENNSIIISDTDNRRIIRCNGYLYVSDCKKHEVKRWKIGDKDGTIVAGGNGKGNKLNQLDRPAFIYINDDSSLYVSDLHNDRVMKWIKDAKEGIIVAGGNGRGNSFSQLNDPLGVIVDQFGQIYVADYGNERIMRWIEGAKEGTIVVGGNGQGEQSNQLNGPYGLSSDLNGNLYIVDCDNHRIQIFEIDLN